MALNQPIRKSDPIYVRRVVTGKVQFVRQPMNVVTLDFGDGKLQTFVEPAGEALIEHNLPAAGDPAGEIRVYDGPPYPGSSFND